MTSDLEQQLRESLRRRGDEITRSALRHPDLRPTPARAAAPWTFTRLAPVVAAAAVLLVVVGVALAVRGGGSGDTTTGSRTRTDTLALAGTAWQLVEVDAPGGRTTTVPDEVGASIGFERGGTRLTAHDGVNSSSTTYSVTGAGDLRLGAVATTAIGYVGHDPAVLAAVAGVGAVVSQDRVVAVSTDGRQLRLRAAGYTLVYSDSAQLGTSAAPAPGQVESS